MDRLKQLPEISNRLLGGLMADHNLKQKIIRSAVDMPIQKPFRIKTAALLTGISLMLILFCFFIAGFPKWTAAQSPEIHNIPAGSRITVSPLNLNEIIEKVARITTSSENDK